MSEVFLAGFPSLRTSPKSQFVPSAEPQSAGKGVGVPNAVGSRPQRSTFERRWFFFVRKWRLALLAGILAPAWLMADPAPTVGSALPVSATVTATATATARIVGSHPQTPAPGLPMTFELNQGQYI